MSNVSDGKSYCWLCDNVLENQSCEHCLRIMNIREVKMIKLLGTLDYQEIADLRVKLDMKNMISQLKLLSIFMHGFSLMIGLLLENYLMIFGTILFIYPTSILIWRKL